MRLVLFINFSVVCAISALMVKVSDITSGEHIGVSPLTGKKVKPSNNKNFLMSMQKVSVKSLPR